MQTTADNRHHPTVTRDGIYGFFDQYRFLSNFHVCKVQLDGFEFTSSEHAFMAQKSLDLKDWLHILTLQTPNEAKKYGQTVKLRDDWNEYRVIAMTRALFSKFQDHDLRARLLQTGNLYLEETNYWGDRYWGVDAKTGEGKNMLGKCLMLVRDSLK